MRWLIIDLIPYVILWIVSWPALCFADSFSNFYAFDFSLITYRSFFFNFFLRLDNREKFCNSCCKFSSSTFQWHLFFMFFQIRNQLVLLYFLKFGTTKKHTRRIYCSCLQIQLKNNLGIKICIVRVSNDSISVVLCCWLIRDHN